MGLRRPTDAFFLADPNASSVGSAVSDEVKTLVEFVFEGIILGRGLARCLRRALLPQPYTHYDSAHAAAEYLEVTESETLKSRV